MPLTICLVWRSELQRRSSRKEESPPATWKNKKEQKKFTLRRRGENLQTDGIALGLERQQAGFIRKGA